MDVWPLWAPSRHMVYIHTCGQNTHPDKIRITHTQRILKAIGQRQTLRRSWSAVGQVVRRHLACPVFVSPVTHTVFILVKHSFWNSHFCAARKRVILYHCYTLSRWETGNCSWGHWGRSFVSSSPHHWISETDDPIYLTLSSNSPSSCHSLLSPVTRSGLGFVI